VRRSENCLGGIRPPIDDHDTVAPRPEAVLVEERVFAECLEFSRRGPDRIWGSYVSDTYRSTIIFYSKTSVDAAILSYTPGVVLIRP
jgi:hypothetical protein